MAAHRWIRFEDPVTHDWNHWCVDCADLPHHPEPCADADSRTGDHAEDATTQEEWPIFQSA